MKKGEEKRGKPDYILLGAVLFLILLGILILVSVSAAPSLEQYGSSTWLLFRHVAFGLLPGALLGYIAFRSPLSRIKKWAPILLLGNLFLMVLVFFPVIGISAGGASRWLNLGITSFQPSEFLKITFILYLAAWLSSSVIKKNGSYPLQKINNASNTFTSFLIIIGIITALLVMQPDVSTWGVIVMSAVLMYFLSGTPIKHSLYMVAGCIGALFLLIKLAPYRFERFLVFIKPDIDPMGLGYQIKQALIAVGSGGILGKGLGMGLQRYGFVPQSMGDSIFAIFSEETGFLGSFILIALFMVFAWRGFAIARNSKDAFSKLVCLGVSSWITIQSFINIGAMLGLLPLTGIPLPFISYGGSALVAELIAVGIMLNISTKTS
ncbi:MAG: putative peptidoglycan glycosyltransferase FtsW [Candidatus Pacebacteria bacterium]|jgi:cell division protein FtsW|nr:putative peptidoglycan glycosyltransferase FtsW [Candidatus Paceibacterota bacterium]